MEAAARTSRQGWLLTGRIGVACRHLVVVILFLTSLAPRQALAEDPAALANVIFSEALALYTQSQGKDAETQKAAAQDVLILFDLIVSSYPDSLPAQRIMAGGKVGPIDQKELRELASAATDAGGVEGQDAKVADNAPEAAAGSDAPEGSLGGVFASMGDLLPSIPKLRAPPWHRMIVAGASPDGGYHHGQFPSAGQRTHPGLDLIATCGSAVASPWEGIVERVSKADGPDFPQLGNAVIVTYRSAPAGGEDAIRVAYLGLGATPIVAQGDVVRAGQRLGITGKLHDLESCGVHLEIRNFTSTESGVFPLWHQMLAVGDWRSDPDFVAAWRDPDLWAPWFSSRQSAEAGAPVLLAGKDWVAFYSRSGSSTAPVERNLWSKTKAGQFVSSHVTVTVDTGSPMQIVVSKISDAANSGLLLRGRKSDGFFLGVRFLKNGKIVSGVSQDVRLVRNSDGWATLEAPATFSLAPDYYLARQPDRLRFVLLGGAEGTEILLGELAIDDLFQPMTMVDPDEATLRDLRDLAGTVSGCLPWNLADGVLLTVPVQAGNGLLVLDPAAEVAVRSATPEQNRMAEVYGKTLGAMLAACPGLKIEATGAEARVDLVLGWPVQ